MTDANQADGHEALLTLIDRAQREISDALVDFSPDKAGDARQLCVNYLDHIVIAATRAGLDNLYLVTEALLALYGDEEQPFSAERGSEFLGWLADAYLYLESPDSPEFLNLLLSPLPADQQAALGAILGEAEAVDE